MELFFSTLNQTLYLFMFIIMGYVLCRFRIMPENSDSILAKLENYIFMPALVMGTFIDKFTVDNLQTTGKIFLDSTIAELAVIVIAYILSVMIIKEKYMRNICIYGLSFSNFSFMGTAVVGALFPDIFFEYIVFTLPIWIIIYLWGVPALLIPNKGGSSLKDNLKKFINPMFIGMLIGMVIGITQIPLPDAVNSVISNCSNCMSPVAMLMTGMAIAYIDIKKVFRDIRVYLIALCRLVVLPLIVALTFKFLPISETVYICSVISAAMPLGLNIIIIPSAYGQDTTVPASMALMAFLFACITIPIIFAVVF